MSIKSYDIGGSAKNPSCLFRFHKMPFLVLRLIIPVREPPATQQTYHLISHVTCRSCQLSAFVKPNLIRL